MDKTAQKICAWGLVASAVLMGIGLIPFAHLIPPTSPAASGEAIADQFADNATGIRIGMVFGVVGVVFIYAYGAAAVGQARRIDPRWEVLCRLQSYLWVAITVLGELMYMIWAVAAFRPGDIDPDITRMLNDLCWALMVFVVPQFSILLMAFGAVVLLDKRRRPIFPRWFGWLTVWVGVAEFAGLLMPFFKTGSFSYRGAITFYVPLGAFAIWLVPATWALIKAIDEQDDPEHAPPAAPVAAPAAPDLVAQ